MDPVEWLRDQLKQLHVLETMLWRWIDSDGNGTVTPMKFARGLQAIGLNCTPETAQRLFVVLDHDADGKVTKDEVDRALYPEEYGRRKEKEEQRRLWREEQDKKEAAEACAIVGGRGAGGGRGARENRTRMQGLLVRVPVRAARCSSRRAVRRAWPLRRL